MATCGCCKAEGQTIEHVKQCYAERRSAPTQPGDFAQAYVAKRDFQPMAISNDPWENVPDSKYAVHIDGVLTFFELQTGVKGKWKGFRFLNRLVGHPGDWAKYAVKGEEKKRVLALIGENPAGSARTYGRNFTVCGVCNSPLSDPESVQKGIGPVCEKRF